MCKRKEDDGLSFKNLHCFNLVLLGKLGWKLIAEPHSLVMRILKLICFPKMDFMNASLRHIPSFVWRSIHNSQEVIRKGSRWRVGKGNNVKVYFDVWLMYDSNRFIETWIIKRLKSLRVCDLILDIGFN